MQSDNWRPVPAANYHKLGERRRSRISIVYLEVDKRMLCSNQIKSQQFQYEYIGSRLRINFLRVNKLLRFGKLEVNERLPADHPPGSRCLLLRG